ncbi:MAG: hypothetical protein GF329_06230, partial [Candidatus Lokiarchaeota archaeon]|nr:hypothetical protein [Candidatus Lokiarchaeota archaeon]
MQNKSKRDFILIPLYFFINLGRMLANWGMEFLASFADAAKAALEAAIKIIILVFTYLILAMVLLGLIIAVGMIFVFSFPILALLGGTCYFSGLGFGII